MIVLVGIVGGLIGFVGGWIVGKVAVDFEDKGLSYAAGLAGAFWVMFASYFYIGAWACLLGVMAVPLFVRVLQWLLAALTAHYGKAESRDQETENFFVGLGALVGTIGGIVVASLISVHGGTVVALNALIFGSAIISVVPFGSVILILLLVASVGYFSKEMVAFCQQLTVIGGKLSAWLKERGK